MTEKTCQSMAVILAAVLTVVVASAGAQTPAKPKPLPPVPATPAPQIKAPTMAGYVADTQQPVMKSGTISTGTLSWQCQGSRCQASGAAAMPTVNACRALASQVGAIRWFAIGNQQLDAGSLTQCNAGLAIGAAKSPAPTTLDQMQKAMPGPKPGMVPDRPAKPEVWQQGKAGSDSAPAPKFTPGPGKPSGGFVPKDPSGQAPADASKAKQPAAASGATKKTAPGPVAFSTTALTITGTGALPARLPFTPRSFTTSAITVTGTGALPERLPFTPRSFSTTPLTLTGSGSL